MSPKKKPAPKPRKRQLDADLAEKGYDSAKVAAALLRVDVKSLHRLCEADKLEHIRVGGDEDGNMQRVFVKRTSIRTYLGPEVSKLLGV